MRKKLLLHQMALTIGHWTSLSATQLGESISILPEERQYIADLRFKWNDFSDFLNDLRNDRPDLFKSLQTIIDRDYTLRTEEMCVYIHHYHYSGNPDPLEEVGISLDEPITSMEQLMETINSILTKTKLNVQMVWSEVRRMGTLYVDTKNFNQRPAF